MGGGWGLLSFLPLLPGSASFLLIPLLTEGTLVLLISLFVCFGFAFVDITFFWGLTVGKINK